MSLLAGIVEDRSRLNVFSYYSRKMLFILVVVFLVVSSSATNNSTTEKPALTHSDVLLRSPLERFKVLPTPKSQLGASQDFYALREKCLKDGELFKDPEFDTVYSSVFYSNYNATKAAYEQIKWLRPRDIVKQPKFIVNGTSRSDVMQGGVGDCWFLSVLANVASNNATISQNVPDDQSFEEKYCGIFHFRFWQMGYWVDVVVDDRLPVNSSSKLSVNGSLMFANFSQGNEFWVPLIEKAYAKLYGSYEALEGGLMYEAMEDLTGGLVASFDLHMQLIPIPEFFRIIEMSSKTSSIIAAAILQRQNVTGLGLVNRHAYSITKVKTLENKNKEIVSLLRIRNPWGQREWTGPWRDNATDWESVSEEDKKELGLKQANDGEYWMTYKDFFNTFDLLDICMINPDKLPVAISTNSSKSYWEVSVFEDQWIHGKTAGGCKIDTLHQNPQYQITITETEGDSKLAFFFVGLMQESQRTLRNVRKYSERYLEIGFVIYKAENSTSSGERLTEEYINEHKWFETSLTYSTWRDVTRVFRVPPGIYTIIPCTFTTGIEGKFILRVATTKKKSTQKL